MIDETLHAAYWRTLFDDGDVVCVAKHLAGTKLYQLLDPAEGPRAWAQYVALNAFAAGTRRADANVVKHRSFLVEFDGAALDVQAALVESVGLPWSSCVFSGGKSLHFIISLETPVSAQEYKQTALRLLGTPTRPGAFPSADAACKNASRFTRYPSVLRIDTQREQELLEVRGRVPNAALEAWLAEHAPHVPVPVLREVRRPSVGFAPRNRLRNETIGFLQCGAERERNLELFRAACDFAECGFSEDESLAQLVSVLPLLNAQKNEAFTENELRRTVESAYRRALQAPDEGMPIAG